MHVGGGAALGMEAGSRQDNPLGLKLGNTRVKMGVVDVGSRAVPGTHQPPLVQEETELPADNPPMIAHALLANRGRAAPFPPGVHQLDAVAVRDAQDRGRCSWHVAQR